MKKSLLCSLCCVLTMFSAQVFAGGQTGKIIEVYAHPNGPMAVRLDQPFVSANLETPGKCGTTNIEWAGVDATAHPSIKAAILTAKATAAEVTLVFFGNCVGGWIKIEAMHVK